MDQNSFICECTTVLLDCTPRTEFCDYGFDTALYACEISCKQRQFNCTCLIKSMSSVNHFITIAAILQRFL